jgi:hypothetical protein
MSRRQDHAALVVLVIVFVLLAAGVGAWLWLQGGGRVGPTTRGPEPEPVDNSPAPTIDPSVPIASGERLPPAPWQPVSPPTPASTTNPGPIQLTDERWVIISSDQIFFSARASAPETDSYIDSTLKIWVVDKAEHRVAAAESSVPLIVGKLGQMLRVQIPLELYEKQVEGRMEWRVVPGRKLDSPMPVEVTSAQVLGSRKFTTLLLTYRNAGPKPVNSFYGVLTALDERGQASVQWRIRWKKNLAPGATAQVAAAVPLATTERVAEWQTDLIGTWAVAPAPGEAASEPATPTTAAVKSAPAPAVTGGAPATPATPPATPTTPAPRGASPTAAPSTPPAPAPAPAPASGKR